MTTTNNISLFLKRVELNQSMDYVLSAMNQLNFGTITNLEIVPRINDDGVHIYNAVIIKFSQWNCSDNTKYFLEKLAISDRKLFHGTNKKFWYVTQNTSIETETLPDSPSFLPVPEGSDSPDFIKKLWEENASLTLQLKYANAKIATQHSHELELENTIIDMEHQFTSFRTNEQFLEDELRCVNDVVHDLEVELNVVNHDNIIAGSLCQELMATTDISNAFDTTYNTAIRRTIAGDNISFNDALDNPDIALEFSTSEIPYKLFTPHSAESDDK